MKEVLDWIQSQLNVSQGECRRLFHGRGRCFPGYEQMVIDWYPPCAVIRLYAETPSPVIEALCHYFESENRVETLLLQVRYQGANVEHRVLFGEAPESMIAQENGLSYEVFPNQFQNSGLFLDMRHGRKWVSEHSKGRKVLNLFSYTCAFSVAAMAGEADCVVNVDMSKRALSIGRNNHALNHQELSRVKFMPYNLLKSWSRIKKPGPYDLVIIDPPSFQPGSFIAEKDYQKVMRRLPELLNPGAEVLACHNDPQQGTNFVRTLMKDLCPFLTYKELLAPQIDFPDQEPESGVKALVFEYSE